MYLKFKKQDICVFPKTLSPQKEILDFKGLFNTDAHDEYGELFTEHILTINLRSQLSSLGNNIDTMFERTYAEPINLHRRLPKMVLGEVYLLSVRELDSKEVKQYKPVYKPITESTRYYLERYINGFSALNLRHHQRDDDFKYEKVALIPVDFSVEPVKVYKNTDELLEDELLPPDSKATIDDMTFDDFVSHLLSVHERRFGSGILR